MKGYRMSLVISFVRELKGDERVDGDELWACHTFTISMKVSREMELCME